MDISYISGFFDADGYITLNKNNSTDIAKSPTIGFTNTKLDILLAIQDFFTKLGIKGHISKRTSTKEGHADSYDLKYRGNKTIQIATLISSFHSKKKDRINLILSDYKNVVKRNGKYKPEDIKNLQNFETKFFLVS